MDITLSNTGYQKAGATILEDGTIMQNNAVEMKAMKEDIKNIREAYHHNNKSDMWHLGTIPMELIDAVRIEKKLPNNAQGRDYALKAVIKMLYDGKLDDFKIHGAL